MHPHVAFLLVWMFALQLLVIVRAIMLVYRFYYQRAIQA